MLTPRMGEENKTTVASDDALDGAARQGRGQDHPPGESARAIPVTAIVPRKVRENRDTEGRSSLGMNGSITAHCSSESQNRSAIAISRPQNGRQESQNHKPCKALIWLKF
ncbi:hypothetical protein [Methylobacterium radiotolerans]|uniref:hypothetical protein n=1 Tax=Methylobacterium radiotolerans TaxID=31998 RepID=UPI001F4081B5|nr:hypothetical protein [Methylobacterium radiotolerans]UIY45007.1 hypothetical protein LZ599_05650 [Methylobacterium radiotolerans]